MFLILLFVIHWVVWLFISFYGLIRKTKDYDWFFLATVFTVIFGWIMNKNECIISLMEKIAMNCSYRVGDRPSHHPSLLVYDFSLSSKIALMCFNILQHLSLSLVLNSYIKNKLGLFVIITALYSLSIYGHFLDFCIK